MSAVDASPPLPARVSVREEAGAMAWAWPAGSSGMTLLLASVAVAAAVAGCWLAAFRTSGVFFVPAVFLTLIFALLLWTVVWQAGAEQVVVLRTDGLLVERRHRGKVVDSRLVPWFRVRRVLAVDRDGRPADSLTVTTEVAEGLRELAGHAGAAPDTHGRLAASAIHESVRRPGLAGAGAVAGALEEGLASVVAIGVGRLSVADRRALAARLEHEAAARGAPCVR